MPALLGGAAVGVGGGGLLSAHVAWVAVKSLSLPSPRPALPAGLIFEFITVLAENVLTDNLPSTIKSLPTVMSVDGLTTMIRIILPDTARPSPPVPGIPDISGLAVTNHTFPTPFMCFMLGNWRHAPCYFMADVDLTLVFKPHGSGRLLCSLTAELSCTHRKTAGINHPNRQPCDA